MDRPLVLVVEDSPKILAILVDILERAGFRAKGAPTALAGIRSARADPPDLILADIMLPDQDGASAMSCLKDYEEFREIPLVLMSAIPREKLEQRKSDSGAVDVIQKPFHKNDLLACVRRWIRTRSPSGE